MNARIWIHDLLIGLLSVGMLACSDESVPPLLQGIPACEALTVAPDAVAKNVIVLINDTMRRDVLGAYGGPLETPNFDAFAGQHLRFDQVLSQAPWTKPSIATLFTSLYPSQHRVESHPLVRGGTKSSDSVAADVLAPSLTTLAEVLKQSDMRTAAVVSNPWMLSHFGFDQGFDEYNDSFANWLSDGNEVIQASINWIERLREGERFFLYIHTIDSHRPYGSVDGPDHESLRRRFNGTRQLTKEVDRSFAARIRLDAGGRAAAAGLEPTEALMTAAYHAGIEDFDVLLGRLLKRLRANEKLWRETALIVTSDHGESLYERGVGNHGGSLYDVENAVPFAARLPGVTPASGVVDCPVGLVDVMPSLCSYLGVSCPDPVQGWSFLPRAGAPVRAEKRYLTTEGIMNHESHRSVRNHRFKLLYEPEHDPRHTTGVGDEYSAYTLIDLETDPLEQFNQLEAERRSPDVERAFGVLSNALAEAVAKTPAPVHERKNLDAELEAHLKSLGYLEARR